MSNGRTKSALVPLLVVNGRFADWCSEEMLGAVEIVGNCAARLNRIMARACWKRASATFKLWLDVATCSSNELSWGSPNISHQLARSVRSPGCAVFHSLNDSGGGSLNAGVIGAKGLWYFGPTMQPAIRSAANVSTPRRNIIISPLLL